MKYSIKIWQHHPQFDKTNPQGPMVTEFSGILDVSNCIHLDKPHAQYGSIATEEDVAKLLFQLEYVLNSTPGLRVHIHEL